jgi:hypothetical protein
MRRRCLGLLAALALLVAPGAAAAIARSTASDGHATARVTVADHHAFVAHVVVRPSSGRERRAPHHSASSLAVLGTGWGTSPGVAAADVAAPLPSTAADHAPSARPRAPPAVV